MKRQLLALLLMLVSAGSGSTLMAADSTAAQSGCEQCTAEQELAELKARVAELEAQINGRAEGQTVTVGDFLRNTDGSVMTNITQREASDACERLGSRLPTVKELIEDAIKRNTGVALLSAEDEATFYYSYRNYKRPTGDLGIYWTWSSSLHPDIDNFAFGFDGHYGYIYSFSRDYSSYYGSARCVARVNR